MFGKTKQEVETPETKHVRPFHNSYRLLIKLIKLKSLNQIFGFLSKSPKTNEKGVWKLLTKFQNERKRTPICQPPCLSPEIVGFAGKIGHCKVGRNRDQKGKKGSEKSCWKREKLEKIKMWQQLTFLSAVDRRICKEKQGGFIGFERRVKRTKIKGKGGEGRSPQCRSPLWTAGSSSPATMLGHRRNGEGGLGHNVLVREEEGARLGSERGNNTLAESSYLG